MYPSRREARRPVFRPRVFGLLVPVLAGLGCAASGRDDFDLAARLKISGRPAGGELATISESDWTRDSSESWALGLRAFQPVAQAGGR